MTPKMTPKPTSTESTAVDKQSNNFSGQYLPGIDLTGADLRPRPDDAELTTGDALLRADFSDATLTDAVFVRANATRALFINADCRGVDFTRADLTQANFSGADLRKANLTGANLAGAILSDADLTEATVNRTNLTYANRRGAVGISDNEEG